MSTNHIDPATLQAALIGYQLEKESIEGKIAEIRKQLGRRASTQADGASAPGRRKKRTLSAAARKRIAAAQRKRWRAYKKAKAAK